MLLEIMGVDSLGSCWTAVELSLSSSGLVGVTQGSLLSPHPLVVVVLTLSLPADICGWEMAQTNPLLPCLLRSDWEELFMMPLLPPFFLSVGGDMVKLLCSENDRSKVSLTGLLLLPLLFWGCTMVGWGRLSYIWLCSCSDLGAVELAGAESPFEQVTEQ